MKTHHFLAICLIYVLCIFLQLLFYFSPSGMGMVKKVTIRNGWSNSGIARELEQEKFAGWTFQYLWYAFLTDRHNLKAGQYLLGSEESVAELIRKMAEGRVLRVKVTFPEGFTSEQMATVLEEEGLCSRNQYLALVRQPALFQKKWLAGVENLEGFLFPDTYYFSYVQEVHDIILTQIDRFETMYPGTIDMGKPQNILNTVVLASIVEKEAREKTEKPLVASVFLNRLKKNMKLESCATVLYAMYRERGIVASVVTLDDVKFPSPYNTYIIRGLPPAPICNPGRDSLTAVLHPSPTDYLYFVLGDQGEHLFSRTFQEHLQNKKKSRKPSQ
ncbi:MAG: endolytic transglycosylase MltG [Candidatus Atribacteria bacterium]|nr:endolytic transglycosylase MltG [Candidatus Atribacteria bacterium]